MTFHVKMIITFIKMTPNHYCIIISLTAVHLLYMFSMFRIFLILAKRWCLISIWEECYFRTHVVVKTCVNQNFFPVLLFYVPDPNYDLNANVKWDLYYLGLGR